MLQHFPSARVGTKFSEARFKQSNPQTQGDRWTVISCSVIGRPGSAGHSPLGKHTHIQTQPPAVSLPPTSGGSHVGVAVTQAHERAGVRRLRFHRHHGNAGQLKSLAGFGRNADAEPA